MFTGFQLEPTERDRLLAMFPPRYPDIIADHVTLNPHAKAWGHAPQESFLSVVGIADDGRGLECLVVTVNGLLFRPDKRTFHCTWSLSRALGYHARDSNDVIRRYGFVSVESVAFNAYPKIFH